MARVKRFRLRDLASTPGVLTLVRAPLAVAFPFFVDRRAGALVILAAAAASDVLDGWCARRSGRTTVTGEIADSIVDKLFVASVAATLLVTKRLSLTATLLLGSRDLVELPLVFRFAFGSRTSSERFETVKANLFGKLVTVLQFATVAAALVAVHYVTLFALVTGVSGVVAGVAYWVRALRHPPETTERRWA